MENNIDVSRELELAGLKKQSLEGAYEVAQSQSNSIMLFTLRWKELEEHLNKTMKLVEGKGIEVDSKLKLLEERERVVELKESELVSVQTRIEECNGELERKIKELGSVRRSVEEFNVEIEGKEIELGLIRRRIEECSCEFRKNEGELDVLRTSVSDWTEKLSLKNVELCSIECLIEKLVCNGELDSKIKELGSVRRSIEECNGETEGKKTELDSIRRRIEECSCEFRKREGELDVLRTSVSDWTEKLELKQNQLSETERLIEVRKEKFDLEEQSIKTMIQDFNEELEAKEHDYNEIKKSIQACNKELETKREKLKLTEERLAELHSQVGKLESLKNNARRRIDSTEKKLIAMKGELRRYGNDIELREREFNALCKYTDEYNEELTLKQQQLNSVQDSIEKCTKELKEKEEQTMSIEKTLVKCSEELEQNKKQLGSVQNSLEELSDEHLSEELELDLVRSMTSQVYEELKEKEQYFNSLENSLKERVQDLEVKEAQFKERIKERVQVKIEQPEMLGASEGVGNGRILQMLMNEHLKKADLFLSEISSSLEGAQDPAKLVLEAMQGFYPKCLHEKESPDLIVIRRTCMLLLQRLLIVSPLIIPQVRDAAMKLAGEWKEKMRVVADNPLEVLGFLNLVAAFGLVSDFDGNELGKLLDIADPHKQSPELCHALGITDQLYVNQIIPSQIRTKQSENITVVSNTTMPKEVSAALLVSPDPAKLVLDLIQGSYSENKKEGTDMEEGAMRNYILLLEQLQEVLPKINPQVKAQAMKLAIKWKRKMRAVAENSLEIFGFLQLLATYELVVSFQREEIFKLLFPVAHLKQALKICTALGFADMAPEFVRILIERNQLLEAIKFIRSFKLMDSISPVPVFKKYMENVDTSATNIYKEGNYSLDAKDKALRYRIASLRALIECTEECKLDSLIGTENVRKEIVNLEKQMAELNQFVLVSNPMTPLQFMGENHNVAAPSNQPASGLMLQLQHGDKNNHNSGSSVPGSVQKCIVKPVEDNSQWTCFIQAPNVMTPQQLLQGKNWNFGASTAASQPAFCPAEQNYSSSASVPGNQLHQQNSNKRPRTDQGPGVSNVSGQPQHN